MVIDELKALLVEPILSMHLGAGRPFSLSKVMSLITKVVRSNKAFNTDAKPECFE